MSIKKVLEKMSALGISKVDRDVMILDLSNGKNELEYGSVYVGTSSFSIRSEGKMISISRQSGGIPHIGLIDDNGLNKYSVLVLRTKEQFERLWNFIELMIKGNWAQGWKEYWYCKECGLTTLYDNKESLLLRHSALVNCPQLIGKVRIQFGELVNED